MPEIKKPTSSTVRAALKKLADAEKAAFFPRFFKTGPGEYAEGDKFYGVTVPRSRSVARQFLNMPLPEIQKLLYSPIHEERFVALLILVEQFKKGDEKSKKYIFNFYLKHKDRVNNWDLVDTSAPLIAGAWLLDKPTAILDKLAASKNLWHRRIAILATFAFIKKEDFEPALRIIKTTLNDKHDLIHKAAGWMLREIGNRAPEVELEFLDRYAPVMPRTMLRYAIEKFPQKQRMLYLKLKP